MGKKTTQNIHVNPLIAIVGSLILGTVAGYLLGVSTHGVPSDYLGESSVMMKNYGSTMRRIGKTATEMGQMMQQRGSRYADFELKKKGQELEKQGVAMDQEGGMMIDRGSDMMWVMGQ